MRLPNYNAKDPERFWNETRRVLELEISAMSAMKFTQGRILQLQPFVATGLPTATQPGRLIYVSDESGGAIPAFSDGSFWRRTSDRAVVS